MATILEIKQQNNDNIRIKVLPSSITKINDANMRDTVADEIRDRGVLRSDDTAGLAAISPENTRLVIVLNDGIFEAIETPEAANNITTFDSAVEGWLWERIAAFQTVSLKDRLTTDVDYEYVLDDGYLVDKIMIKPSVEETMKVGLTEDGDEIMFEDVLAANQWKTISRDVVADGGDVSIYFSGITDDTELIIYKRAI